MTSNEAFERGQGDRAAAPATRPYFCHVTAINPRSVGTRRSLRRPGTTLRRPVPAPGRAENSRLFVEAALDSLAVNEHSAIGTLHVLLDVISFFGKSHFG